MIIMVTGGRDYDDALAVRRALEPYAQARNILLSGGARGADFLAEQEWGWYFQLPYVVMPAPWNRAGRAAGQMRNGAMIVGNAIAPYAKLVPDVVLAFPGGRGTAHAKRTAREQGIEVIEFA